MSSVNKVSIEATCTTPFPVAPLAAGSAEGPSVLFVDQSGQLGGAELSLLPLVTMLATRREVLLLTDGPFRQRLESMDVTVHLTIDDRVARINKDAVHLSWLFALPGIVRQIQAIARHARRFDILFLNTQKALVLGALGKPLHRRKIVWHLRDIMSPDHFGPLQRLVVKWATRYAVDYIVANSHATAAALADLIKCDPSAVPVVYNGVDAGEFDQVDDQRTKEVRRLLNLADDTRLVGLFGRIAPWKGQHVAIDALAQIPGLHLVLVGSALFGEQAYEKSLREQAVRLGIEDRVHFAGFQDDMPQWMRAVDMVLHTSTVAEPFGRVIIEGMAAGRPVIAAAAGGVVEILQHHENGWLVSPGDATALAEAIEALYADPGLAQRLAAKGLINVKRDFSLNAYIAQMNKVIRGIEY
ncbi:glycosyltransferase family 4 protein [Paraburkholderia sp. J67]|uniref:glycosyltransferase family 4 protein n=1 Tax=Paraburkholderia sp. J67 TaxID=2805435 RepID=UPI002ABD1CC8|nr:glycosyltransferase family 4 protein [Paraburkholderia sp. J67]